MKPVLLMTVGHGMHVRNLMNSSIMENLKRDFRIVVVTYAADEPFIRAAYGGPDIEFAPFARDAVRYEERYAFIRRYVLSNPKRNQTVNVFGMQFRAERPVFYKILMLLNRVLGRFSAVRRAWLAFEHAMIPGREYDPLFRSYKPAALISAHYGITPDDIRLIRAARRAGVPSIAVVPSWDNLSSKGIMGAPPDKLVVWNEIMREEAVDLHDYKPENVVAVGGVQFDVYGDRAAYDTREKFCKRFGMDPNRKIVVYGTITPVYFPYNVRLVEMLAEISKANRTGEPFQVLVRLHPQVVRDAVHGDSIADYERVVAAFPGTVFLNVPEVETWSQMTPPKASDALLLGAMLYHADVCVVPGSTLALDSVANGTPVIGVAFDGDDDLPYGRSIRRWYDFTYYKPLLEMGGLELAWSPAEMAALLRRMLADKAAGAETRARVIERYLGALDGKAGGRAAEQIRTIAGI